MLHGINGSQPAQRYLHDGSIERNIERVVTPVIQVRLEEMYEAKNKTEVMPTHEDTLHSFRSLEQGKGEVLNDLSQLNHQDTSAHVNQDGELAAALLNYEADSNAVSNPIDTTHE